MKVIVVGPRGKMGKLITQIAASRNDMELVAGVAPKGREYIGRDLGQVAMTGYDLGVLVVDDLASVIDSCDVIIDFSTKETAMEVLNLAIAHKKALVCGTTGFSAEEMQRFKDASAYIPMLYAANTSKLVNVMNKLLEVAAASIGEEADIEILEMHDQWKKDAPSGTSKEMGEIIAHTMGRELEDIAVYGRHGVSPRENGTIGYHSLRAGNIPSSHTVFFGFMGERLEITHHSYNWECFARGACDCAAYLADKEAGFYTIRDVLNL
ncbi:4-hydroxy-tetrahydrodipicolinate reductase [Lachnospiraceae bacterium]|uniref:4-hydroxy-tetrahydrodipicolinate reductase n=1 Tax=Extibacter sp. GGCC_0201 TaxID=2731209 RepID=UPI001AA178DE|nr:4-hydroxy-tetrahydrodipicolinate reductase [Extibacter sp. GGCC_0201]MBO1722725.1 4-hydroxy-tetrahydrodipicolinate reductase [Extibacter sp. GGCC_0201]BDF32891.1 4-hydroxy-tetrahydrodipicolinate reductase [Lachnospiraceae bacterium]BDF36896.1 4-hydroxy-tetrahydrodipicolinate reductase [Lachnospiraceae bacterium]